jgi:hypothetical protein
VTDPFSAAANAAAFVGLADLACRGARELYVFISALKSATAEIRKLGRELQDLEQIISSLRRYCADFVSAASAPADTAVLSSLVSCMKTCDEELCSLKQLLHSKAAPRDAMHRFGIKVKWVFDEDKIAKSSLRLDRTKLSLNTALAMLGRRFYTTINLGTAF